MSLPTAYSLPDHKGGRCVYVWDSRTGQKRFCIDRGLTGSESSPIRCMLPLRDNRLVVGTGRHVLHVFNYKDGTKQLSSMHKESVICLAEFSGMLLLTFGNPS